MIEYTEKIEKRNYYGCPETKWSFNIDTDSAAEADRIRQLLEDILANDDF